MRLSLSGRETHREGKPDGPVTKELSMHRHRLAAVATALVLWMGAAPHLAEGEQQTRRRAGRSAAAAGTEQQRS
ncbi:MAG: hypothetical protein J4F37_00325, partial [Acidobacteria bacterium]|nr:hypothetical protein [Acidobacteriota bacterium]